MNKLLLPDILNSAWAAEDELLSQFRQTPYYTQLLQAHNSLDTSVLYESGLHGPDHIERVMLLATLIAWRVSLSDHDTQLLLTACSYHDIGRVHDGIDDDHGRRSAKKLRELSHLIPSALSGYDLRILFAIITLHSLSDVLKHNVAVRYRIPAEQKDRYLELAACLKDADNLDRVRLDDLDVSHLRHEISIDLAPFAKELYNRYLQVLNIYEFP